jgi:hypothetical protein
MQGKLFSLVLSSACAAGMICAGMLGTTAQGQDSPQAVSVPLITQAVDEARVTTLKGNTHPLARPEFDLGTAPATLPMDRMLLVLKRSDAQEFALRKLLDDQQDKASPNYHKWLTPEKFGRQFGPSDSDLQIITSWLQSHGFQVGSTKGRTVLEFSGSASQVREAFHTSIHKYVVNGEQHWANSSDPMIPSALTGAVAGVLSMHNFLKKPASHFSGEAVPAKLVPGKKPQVTFPAQNGQGPINALAPQDYAVIYNINPVYSNNNVGSLIRIGVVGRSNLFNGGEDVSDFRLNAFGLPGPSLTIVLNGPDPGDLGGGEEAEATLDSTWSSAIAPGATTDFVLSASTNTTDGIDLSEVYIVDNNLTDIMTESFSSCELGATNGQLAFASAVAEQAAAQGITYFVSTGDNGAEGCDDPSNPPATNPISVNLLASTAFNVAVGGTMFNENGQPTTYWGSENPVSESAISYIPEDVWNESSLTNGLWAGSGGASVVVSPKPNWQTPLSLGIPNDGVRDLPDVSLTAAGHDPYLLCLEGSCVPNGQGQFFVFFISGTSASAPSFAGVMALVDQQMGGRQGLANYVLYRLAANQALTTTAASCNGSNTAGLPASNCIFNDVTVGNNVVPGETGTSYQAATGYDLATGLGSVNVSNLINSWNTVTFNATTTTLGLNPKVNITHGASINVNVSVTPNSGTAKPTGDVSLVAGIGSGQTGMTSVGTFTLSAQGTVVSSTAELPGGGPYAVTAHYAGDATFGGSDSSPVSVTVNPEGSTTSISDVGQNGVGIPNGSSLPFGSGVFVRADVIGTSQHGVPTGQVTFTDSFGNLPGAIFNPVPNPVALNSEGNTSIGDGVINFDAGNHSITAAYGGDASFNSSSTGQPITFTIQPGFAGVSGPTNVTITSPGLSGTSSVGIIASTGFSTPVTFTCTGLPAEAACVSTPAAGSGPNTVVTTSITVTTMGPHTTRLQSDHRQYYFAVLFGGGLPMGALLLIVGRGPRNRRWRVLLGLSVLALLVALPACGGGGGSSTHQDPGTPAGNYQVTITATAGSLSEQATFNLSIQ